MPIVGNVITGSNDITYLDVQVTFDLSGLTPAIEVVNASQGPNLQNVTYWFTVNSPSNTPIHAGSFSSPDATGEWTEVTLSDSWPMPWNQIEWSGPPYSFSVFAQDSAGNVYQVEKTAYIQEVPGCQENPGTYFGPGNVDLRVLCEQGQIFFEDKTNSSYAGLQGTQTGSLLVLAYPVDQTNTVPPPFTQSPFSNSLVPITYSGTNYQFTYSSTWNYSLGNNVFLLLTFRQQRQFPVLCNIDFGALVCELQEMMEKTLDGDCSQAGVTQFELTQINTLLNIAMIGKTQPLLGVDVYKAIELAKKIGNFKCDCCPPFTAGIRAQSSSVIGNYNFSINGSCGISGSVVPNGNNITFNLKGQQYVFNTSATIPTQAFSVQSSTNGCFNIFSLNVNLATLSNDILETILGNPALVNLLNSAINPTSQKWYLKGGCIFQGTDASNYAWSLVNVPASGTNAIVTSLMVGTSPMTLNFAFNLTSLTALQTYLNSLNVGVFTVVNNSGIVVITSNTNTNTLGNLTYTVGATSMTAAFSSENLGTTPIDPQTAVQNIITYICSLTDAEITTSQEYIVGGISNGQSANTDIAEGSTLQDLLETLTNSYNNLVSYVLTLGAVNCKTIGAVFPSSTNLLSLASVLYGTKTIPGQNGQPNTQGCSSISPAELFLFMLQNMTPAAQAAFCAAVQVCGQGQTCQPYNNLTVTVVPHNTTCPSIVGMIGSFS